MVSEKLTVINKLGLHMRPARTFVQTMAEYQSDVAILFNGKRVNGKSIMGMMTLGLDEGDSVNVIADGADEREAVNEIEKYLSAGR